MTMEVYTPIDIVIEGILELSMMMIGDLKVTIRMIIMALKLSFILIQK